MGMKQIFMQHKHKKRGAGIFTPRVGAVKTTREGHAADGGVCREFQQTVVIAGKEEQAFGAACRQRDGARKITDTPG
jgi:surface antigen